MASTWYCAAIAADAGGSLSGCNGRRKTRRAHSAPLAARFHRCFALVEGQTADNSAHSSFAPNISVSVNS